MCVCVSITFKIYSLNLWVYNTVLLKIYLPFCTLDSPEFIHLIVRSLYPLTCPHPQTPASGNHQSTLYFYEFDFFSFCVHGISYSVCLHQTKLISLEVMPSKSICVVTNCKICSELCDHITNINSYIIYIYNIFSINPSMDTYIVFMSWMLGKVLQWTWGAGIFPDIVFISLGY